MMPMGQAPRRDVTGARVGAWVIDFMILGVLGLLIVIGMRGIETNTFSSGQRARAYCQSWEEENFGSCSTSLESDLDSRNFNTWTTTQIRWTPMILAGSLNLILYPLVQGLTGATPGKALVGLRVVRRDGQTCGVGRSFLRHILWLADGILCGLPVVGGAVMLSTQNKQRVGDLAAGTFVVHRTEVGTPIPDQVWMPMAPPLAPGPYGTSGHPGFQSGVSAHGWAPPPVPPAPGGQSWGQGPAAPGPGGFGPPSVPGSAGGPGSPPSPSPPVSPGPGDGPTWDAGRGTYIQYDPALGAWMQWNDATEAWERA